MGKANGAQFFSSKLLFASGNTLVLKFHQEKSSKERLFYEVGKVEIRCIPLHLAIQHFKLTLSSTENQQQRNPDIYTYISPIVTLVSLQH